MCCERRSWPQLFYQPSSIPTIAFAFVHGRWLQTLRQAEQNKARFWAKKSEVSSWVGWFWEHGTGGQSQENHVWTHHWRHLHILAGYDLRHRVSQTSGSPRVTAWLFQADHSAPRSQLEWVLAETRVTLLRTFGLDKRQRQWFVGSNRRYRANLSLHILFTWQPQNLPFIPDRVPSPVAESWHMGTPAQAESWV